MIRLLICNHINRHNCTSQLYDVIICKLAMKSYDRKIIVNYDHIVIGRCMIFCKSAPLFAKGQSLSF